MTIIRVTVEVLQINFATVSGRSGRVVVYFRSYEREVGTVVHTSAMCGKSQCESNARQKGGRQQETG